MLADLYRRGELPLDKMVTRTIGLGGVTEAFAAMARGETIRSVLTFA